MYIPPNIIIAFRIGPIWTGISKHCNRRKLSFMK